MTNGGDDRSRAVFRKVEPMWSAEELMEQSGWFPFADVMGCLDPKDTGMLAGIRTRRQNLIKIKRDPAQLMGLKQFGQRLWADMSIFAPWFRTYREEDAAHLRNHLKPRPLPKQLPHTRAQPGSDAQGLGLHGSMDT